MESSFHLISTLLNDLREAGILEYEFVSPQSASQVKLEKVEDAIQMFASRLKTTLEEKPLGKDCIQIKAASKEILDKRIEAFLQRKSEEGRQLTHRVLDGECSRTLPVSYRHIGVEYTRNEAGPGAQGMKPTVVPEERSIENRISAIETQLGLGASSTTNLLCRMKHIEDRLLYLESVSPEYQRLK